MAVDKLISLFELLIKKNKRKKDMLKLTKIIVEKSIGVKIKPRSSKGIYDVASSAPVNFLVENLNFDGESIKLKKFSILFTYDTTSQFKSCGIKDDYTLDNFKLYIKPNDDFNMIYRQVVDQMKFCYDILDKDEETDRSNFADKIKKFEYYTDDKIISLFLKELKDVDIKNVNDNLHQFALFLDCFENIECEKEFADHMNKMYNTSIFHEKFDDHYYKSDYLSYRFWKFEDIVKKTKFDKIFDGYNKLNIKNELKKSNSDKYINFIKELTHFCLNGLDINTYEECVDCLGYFENYISHNINYYNSEYLKILYNFCNPNYTTADPFLSDNHYRKLCGLPPRTFTFSDVEKNFFMP